MTAAAEQPQQVWRSHYATPKGFRYWPNEELVRAVGGRTFDRVLEVGCGNGANLWFLAEHAKQVFGVDSCSEALTEAVRYMQLRGCDEQVSLLRNDARRMVGMLNGVCDAVVDIMTSQHLPWSEHEALFKEYRRVMKTGGWLFLYALGKGTSVSVRSTKLEKFTFDELPELFPGVGPVCLPQAPALREALCMAGFLPASTRQLSRTYPNGAVTTYIVMEATAA